MLARVANSLFWTGRYLERSEYLSRYLKVQYFSTLNSPIVQQREIILSSILSMIGSEKDNFPGAREKVDEQEVLVEVSFNLDNPNSILSSVTNARENARGIRNVLSTELWEVINRYYHFVNDYSIEYYKTRGLYDFTSNVIQNCSIIRSLIDSTLLHDDIWAFIRLGISVEKAAQTLRIISNKLYDVEMLNLNDFDTPLQNYQWMVTLKILETYDMYRHRYRGISNQEHIIMFLLCHPKLSRSLTYTLIEVSNILRRLSPGKMNHSNLAFQAEKLASNFKFLEYKEIEGDLQGFLMTSLNKIYHLNELIEREYFNSTEISSN